ncbi:MAG: DNA-binding protein [Clostridia bacterium]|nr:DNA-binding protein [Clostridia bacterium]
MIAEYMSIAEASRLWGVSPRRIQIYCSDGRIEGAQRFGRVWALPRTAEKPADGRVTTGAYRNRRTTPQNGERVR